MSATFTKSQLSAVAAIVAAAVAKATVVHAPAQEPKAVRAPKVTPEFISRKATLGICYPTHLDTRKTLAVLASSNRLYAKTTQTCTYVRTLDATEADALRAQYGTITK